MENKFLNNKFVVLGYFDVEGSLNIEIIGVGKTKEEAIQDEKRFLNEIKSGYNEEYNRVGIFFIKECDGDKN